MNTPKASSSTVANSLTWVDACNGKYNGVWDGLKFAIPCLDKDIIFEVDGENLSGINTAVATVFGKMARVNRNTAFQNKKANYDGTIDGDKLTLVEKERVM